MIAPRSRSARGAKRIAPPTSESMGTVSVVQQGSETGHNAERNKARKEKNKASKKKFTAELAEFRKAAGPGKGGGKGGKDKGGKGGKDKGAKGKQGEQGEK